jgi:hypothetical protein
VTTCAYFGMAVRGVMVQKYSLEYTTMNSLEHKNKLKEECYVKFIDKFKKHIIFARGLV